MQYWSQLDQIWDYLANNYCFHSMCHKSHMYTFVNIPIINKTTVLNRNGLQVSATLPIIMIKKWLCTGLKKTGCWTGKLDYGHHIPFAPTMCFHKWEERDFDISSTIPVPIQVCGLLFPFSFPVPVPYPVPHPVAVPNAFSDTTASHQHHTQPDTATLTKQIAYVIASN
jgi:hypothetical protein